MQVVASFSTRMNGGCFPVSSCCFFCGTMLHIAMPYLNGGDVISA